MKKTRAHGEGTIRQRADGRWQARIRLGVDAEGKPIRKEFYGQTRKEVAEKLNEYRRERHMAPWGSPSAMTVEELANDWLHLRHGSKSPTTHARREIVLRLDVLPHLGQVRVQQLVPLHVHRMLDALAPEGASKQLMAYTTLRTMLAYAVRMQLIAANPAAAIEKPRPVRKEMAIYDEAQVKAILAAARGGRLAALFVLACCTGMRQGELFGLHWDAIDLEAAALHVRQTLIQVRGEFALKPPKSKAGLRTITLPPLAVEALHEHRKAMLKEGRDVRRGPVFCSRAGTFLRATNFTLRAWKPLLRAAGVPLLPFHSLRHTHASCLLRSGQSIRAVATRLGHADPAMTLRVYVHVLPDEDGRLAQCVQALFG